MRCLDIKNGFMRIAAESPHPWQTNIEAYLVSRCDGREDYAFLASDCRAEDLAEQGPLFNLPLAEVAVVSSWRGNFMFRAGAGIHHPWRLAASRKIHCTDFEFDVQVHAPETAVREVPFQELLADMNRGPRDNNYFMKVSFALDGRDYDIVCPCRYINYSHDQLTAKRYIQPISGYVLAEYGGQFKISYVVTYADDAGTRNTELIFRVARPAIDLKQGFGGWSVRLLSRLAKPLAGLMMVDEFADMVKVDAKTVFFRYGD